jgi:hypothetical protein
MREFFQHPLWEASVSVRQDRQLLFHDRVVQGLGPILFNTHAIIVG